MTDHVFQWVLFDKITLSLYYLASSKWNTINRLCGKIIKVAMKCLVQNLAYHKVVVDKQISSWVVSYVMGQNG